MWRSEAGSFPTVRVDVKLEKTSKTKNRIESFRFRCLCWRGRVRIQQDETEQYGKFKSLTKDVVEQWIDSIYVYGESRIDSTIWTYTTHCHINTSLTIFWMERH